MQGRQKWGAQGACKHPVFLRERLKNILDLSFQHYLNTVVHSQILAPCAVPDP